MIDTTPYQDYLLGEGYRPATARKAAQDLRTWARHGGDLDYENMSIGRIRDYWWAHDAYDEFHREEGAPELPWPAPPNHKDIAAERNAHTSRGRRTRRNKSAKKELKGFTLTEYRKLLGAVVEGEHRADPALHVMLLTGLRVGDVLRTTSRQISKGFDRDDGIVTMELKGGKGHYITVHGAPDAWAALAESARGRKNVAASVSKSGDDNADTAGSAYQSVKRRLYDLCKEHNIKSPHNLHRIRRTVAVLLRKSGATMGDTQEVLGHSSERTTAIYTSEYMPEVAAAALHQMHEYVNEES